MIKTRDSIGVSLCPPTTPNWLPMILLDYNEIAFQDLLPNPNMTRGNSSRGSDRWKGMQADYWTDTGLKYKFEPNHGKPAENQEQTSEKRASNWNRRALKTRNWDLLFQGVSFMLFFGNFTRIFLSKTSGILLGRKERWHSSSSLIGRLDKHTTALILLCNSTWQKEVEIFISMESSSIFPKNLGHLAIYSENDSNFRDLSLFSHRCTIHPNEIFWKLDTIEQSLVQFSNECFDNQLRKTPIFERLTDEKAEWELVP